MPINPDWPSERIQFVFQHSGVQGAILQNIYLEKAIEMLDNVCPDYEEHAINEDYTFIKTNLPGRKYPKGLAYVLFTSGSTGFPKGIVHSSESMFAFLRWCKKEFTRYKIQRFISIAPLNFDLSVFDIFFPVYSKSSVYLPDSITVSNPRGFVQFLIKHKAECIYTTPSYLKLLLQTAQLQRYNLKFVKLILVAGEQLHYDLIRELKKHFSKAVFYNLYGPTETNVCAYHKIEMTKVRKDETNVPIGKSCYPDSIKVNKDSKLYYKGKLLMKAVIDENGVHPVRKWHFYNTGDKVKKLKNGLLVFVGRGDTMVKRNGFRIELSEIKNALSEFRNISNCEVIVSDNPKVEIIAFIESKEAISELELRTFLLTKLPSYMLPDGIIILEKFPVNLNHKTDVQKLKKNFI